MVILLIATLIEYLSIICRRISFEKDYCHYTNYLIAAYEFVTCKNFLHYLFFNLAAKLESEKSHAIKKEAVVVMDYSTALLGE